MPRPKIHPSQALKQWAYRMRVKQRQQALEDAAARIHACLIHTPHAGHDPIETLHNLAQYLELGKTLPQTTRHLLDSIRNQLAQQNTLIADLTQIIQEDNQQ